jgi:2-(1,2-epoxy-1,2-dihydrophenyl)acetyl-CoA isomerase
MMTLDSKPETVLLASRQEGVATITLNRPSALNALDQAMIDGLLAALAQVEADPAVRVVILTGAGRAFCAGGDLFHLLSLKSPPDCRSFIARAGQVTKALTTLPKPVIAMVNGTAAGAGFSLALASDIVFCAASATFAQSFSKVGLVPDCGAQFLLSRIAGPHKAKELMFTARTIDAATAAQLGFINRVIADERLVDETDAFAGTLAKGPPLALAMIKSAVNRSATLDLDGMLALETESQTVCLQTEDFKEGVAAFKAKRTPQFAGR